MQNFSVFFLVFGPGLKPRVVQRTIIRNMTILICVLLSTYDRKI